jgi:hypothetical protein
MLIKRLDDYELEWLKKKTLYINKYDLSIISLFELNGFWKEFAFDILSELTKKSDIMIDKDEDQKDTLLNFIKRNYNTLIKDFELPLSIVDYPNIYDYITLEEWLETEGNSVGFDKKGFYLSSK